MSDTYENDAPAMVGEVLAPLEQDVSALVAAEINQQVATAKRFPRRRDADIQTEIMSRSGLDEDTAAECIYNLERSGKAIVGPSIRFAEIVMMSFGNLRAAARFVEIDQRDPERCAIVVEGVCLDLQNNVSRIIPVRRSIMTSARGGRPARMFNADMTNIAFAAGAAIATREAILKCVPKAVWGPAFRRVIGILEGTRETLDSRRRKVFEAFAKRDIKPETILKALELKGIEDITIEHMPRIFGWLTALADGAATVEQLFGPQNGGEAERVTNNPLKEDDEAEAQPRREAPTEAKAEPPASKAAPVEEAKPVAASAPAKPKEKPKLDPDYLPDDEAGYAEYARAWFPTMKTAADAEARWKSERNLRKSCKLSGEMLDALKDELDRTDFEG